MRLGPLLHLTWHLLKRMVLRLLRRERGLLRFRAHYCGEDRLLPVDSEERAVLVAASGCVACGLCDARFSAYDAVARTEMRGPSDLVLSYSRSLPDYDALHRYLGNLQRGDLDALTRCCPARVPFGALAELVGRRARDLSPPPDPPTGTPRRPHDPG